MRPVHHRSGDQQDVSTDREPPLALHSEKLPSAWHIISYIVTARSWYAAISASARIRCSKMFTYKSRPNSRLEFRKKLVRFKVKHNNS